MFGELIKPLGADVPLLSRESSLPARCIQLQNLPACQSKTTKKYRGGQERPLLNFIFKHLNLFIVNQK